MSEYLQLRYLAALGALDDPTKPSAFNTRESE